MQHIFFSDDFSEYHKSYVYSIKWLRHWLSVKSTALMTRRPCSTTAVRLDSTTKFNVACGHCHLYPMNGNIAISAGFLFCCGGKHLILDLKQRDKNQVLWAKRRDQIQKLNKCGLSRSWKRIRRQQTCKEISTSHNYCRSTIWSHPLWRVLNYRQCYTILPGQRDIPSMICFYCTHG